MQLALSCFVEQEPWLVVVVTLALQLGRYRERFVATSFLNSLPRRKVLGVRVILGAFLWAAIGGAG
jgi:hypothetical protein